MYQVLHKCYLCDTGIFKPKPEKITFSQNFDLFPDRIRSVGHVVKFVCILFRPKQYFVYVCNLIRIVFLNLCM